jgi:hypothetical protein
MEKNGFVEVFNEFFYIKTFLNINKKKLTLASD